MKEIATRGSGRSQYNFGFVQFSYLPGKEGRHVLISYHKANQFSFNHRFENPIQMWHSARVTWNKTGRNREPITVYTRGSVICLCVRQP